MYQNVLDMIGNTPIVELQHCVANQCRVFGKLEYYNPGGSIKDRIALSMIEAAEQAGDIQPGDTLIEATAGNTGLGLALVARQNGYHLRVVLPDKMSQEKIAMLESMGAEVIKTRSDVGKGHPDYYQDKAQALAQQSGGFYVNQFSNSANYQAHIDHTGPEIWAQMDHDVDAVVCGVGSGGTVTGLGRYLKSKNPDIDIVLADPEGSVLADIVHGKPMGEVGSWLVEGIGEDFVPDICDLSLVTHAFTISDRESFQMCRQVMDQEGIMIGTSAGTIMAAALRYCEQQVSPKRVVTIICDGGHKYISKIFNDQWWQEKGLM